MLKGEHHILAISQPQRAQNHGLLHFSKGNSEIKKKQNKHGESNYVGNGHPLGVEKLTPNFLSTYEPFPSCCENCEL